MKRAALSALLMLIAAHGHAQTCNPAQDDCTVAQALDHYRAQPLAAAIESGVHAANLPASPSAGGIHNTYQDFLSLFGFAIESVTEEDNGQVMVVRFNPLRAGRTLLGATLTIIEPAVGQVVQRAIPEDVRAATVSGLDQSLGETDDVTYSLSWSPASPDCPAAERSACWGRSPAAYRELIATVAAAHVQELEPALAAAASDLLRYFPGSAGSLFDQPLSRATDREALLAGLRDLAASERTTAPVAATALPRLIDQQPQFALTTSYRMPGRLGGPRHFEAAFEFHSGLRNVNGLRRRCHAVARDKRAACLNAAITAFATKDAVVHDFVVRATARRTLAYRVDDLWLDQPVEGFTPIDLGPATSFRIRAQAGRQFATPLTEQHIRADWSLEGTFNGSDATRPANRWVSTLTLAVPAGASMTIPVSLTYASEAELLGAQTDRIGAHLGLTWRLPRALSGQ